MREVRVGCRGCRHERVELDVWALTTMAPMLPCELHGRFIAVGRSFAAQVSQPWRVPRSWQEAGRRTKLRTPNTQRGAGPSIPLCSLRNGSKAEVANSAGATLSLQVGRFGCARTWGQSGLARLCSHADRDTTWRHHRQLWGKRRRCNIEKLWTFPASAVFGARPSSWGTLLPRAVARGAAANRHRGKCPSCSPPRLSETPHFHHSTCIHRHPSHIVHTLPCKELTSWMFRWIVVPLFSSSATQMSTLGFSPRGSPDPVCLTKMALYICSATSTIR